MAELLTIARPYAKAAFDFANEHGKTAEWEKLLDFLGEVSKEKEAKALEDNPNVSKVALVDIYVDIAGDLIDEYGINFLKLLAKNHRINLLPFIAGLFREHKRNAEQVMDVEVVSAFKLTDMQMDNIKQSLQKRFGKTVSLNSREDTSLLGGAIIKAGDQIIDGSIRGRLKQIVESVVA